MKGAKADPTVATTSKLNSANMNKAGINQYLFRVFKNRRNSFMVSIGCQVFTPY